MYICTLCVALCIELCNIIQSITIIIWIIHGPASLGTSPPPHPMVMGLYSSAPVPPSPPVVWVVWVVVVVVVEEVVYVCI